VVGAAAEGGDGFGFVGERGNGIDEASELEDFADVILGVREPAIARDDAIASVEVIDAAYESLRRNSWSAVKLRRLRTI